MSDSESSVLSSAQSTIADAARAEIEPSKKRKRTVAAKKSTKSQRATPRKRTKVTAVKTEEVEEVAAKTTPRRSKKAKVEVKEEEEVANPDKKITAAAKKAKKRTDETSAEAPAPADTKPAVKRKRKTKEEKEAEAMPLAPRTLSSKLVLGAHVSSAGGVHNAILNSVHIGGNAFALFLKSQRKWDNPPLQEEHLLSFKSGCREHGYHGGNDGIPPIVPHGSYLVNLAHPDPARTKQAYEAFLDDLRRCARLGIRLYNFHPGSCGASESREAAIVHLAGQLNKAHKDPSSGNVITLLETMTSSTNILGATFEDLANTIELVQDKERVGVCLDTCHVFAAGYDLRSSEAFKDTIRRFDEVIGLKYLKALHVNDSKAPLSSGRDLHANIGTGFLGLRAFHNLVNEPRLWGLPLILETPIDVPDGETGKEKPDKGIWAREIKLLEGLVGMDVEGEEFLALEKALWEKGREERERIQKQVDKKVEKAAKKAKVVVKGGRKAKKGKGESSEDELSKEEDV